MFLCINEIWYKILESGSSRGVKLSLTLRSSVNIFSLPDIPVSNSFAEMFLFRGDLRGCSWIELIAEITSLTLANDSWNEKKDKIFVLNNQLLGFLVF